MADPCRRSGLVGGRRGGGGAGGAGGGTTKLDGMLIALGGTAFQETLYRCVGARARAGAMWGWPQAWAQMTGCGSRCRCGRCRLSNVFLAGLPASRHHNYGIPVPTKSHTHTHRRTHTHTSACARLHTDRAEPVVRDFQKAMSRRGGTAASRLSAAEGDVKRGVGAVREKYSALNHLITQQADLGLAGDLPTAAEAAADAAAAAAEGAEAGAEGGGGGGEDGAGPSGAGAAGAAGEAGAGAAGPSGSGAGGTAATLPNGLGRGGAGAAGAGGGKSAAEAREEAPPCPICLDVPDRRTITTCGHTFCTDCIHDIVQVRCTVRQGVCVPVFSSSIVYERAGLRIPYCRLALVGCYL